LKAELDGDVRRENADQSWRLRLLASGIEVLRYYGQGNDTDGSRGPDAHRVHMQQYAIEPSAVMPVGRIELFAGPVARWSATRDSDGRFLSEIAQSLYGAGRFGQAGARAGLTLDTRDSAVNAMHGSYFAAEGRFFPAWWDVERAFGIVKGEASTYLSVPLPATPVLALRVGGQKNWGPFPFQESAFLGGTSSVRGYPQQRFAGDASLFGSAELRLTAGRTYLAVPAVWGVFGHADAGRVWVDGASPGDVHGSVGGGIWVALVGRANTFRFGASVSREQTTFFVGAGMAF
jgi:outer membrane protein assembly factor BamA